jgi:hypothetical protein
MSYPISPKLALADKPALNDSHIDVAAGSLLASAVVQPAASAAGVRLALIRALEQAGIIAVIR